MKLVIMVLIVRRAAKGSVMAMNAALMGLARIALSVPRIIFMEKSVTRAAKIHAVHKGSAM